jgi:hypothetical protein
MPRLTFICHHDDDPMHADGVSKNTRLQNTTTTTMAKVKLELRSKTDEQLRVFTANHIAAITGNPYYATPDPSAAVYDGAQGSFSDILDEIIALETELKAKRATRDDIRAQLEAATTARGAYVEKASGGDEAKILSAGFEVQATGSATTSLPAPTGLAATMGDNEGEVDLGCDALTKAKTYIFEMREHSDIAAPGPWAQVKISTRSSATVNGLVSGKKYAFRVRALGPNELESPWSAEVVCMAP